jgi:hypothetical protein
VKLFAVPRKGARSVDDPKRTLWFVGSPDSTNWTPRNSKDAHEVNAKATGQAKASNAVKADPLFKHRVKAKLTRVKAVRQKEQRSPAEGEGKVNEQQVQECQDDSDDASDNQEEEEEDDAGEYDAEEDDTEEVDAGEDDAEGDAAGEDIEEDPNDSEGEEDLEEGEEAVVNDENKYDTEEQDDGEHNRASEEAEAEEADKKEDEEHEVEEDLAEDIGEEGEQGAEGQQEAEGEGEREEEDKTSDEIEPHSETRGKYRAVQDGEEEEHGGDGEAREEQGDQDQVQGVENAMGQHATTNNRDGSWRSWKVGDTNGKENEGMCTNAGEEERTAEDENGSAEERMKRAFACSTPQTSVVRPTTGRMKMLQPRKTHSVRQMAWRHDHDQEHRRSSLLPLLPPKRSKLSARSVWCLG